MRDVLLVTIGGGVGAAGRYLATGWVQSWLGAAFPWGTFFVNVTGSFAIGLVLGLLDRGVISTEARLLLAAGCLGGYTTFSSFSYENLQLALDRSLLYLVANVMGQCVAGFLAAYLGVLLIRLVEYAQ